MERHGKRCCGEEAPEHIGGQPIDVVLVAVVAEAAGIGYRADRENGTSTGTLEEHHVRPYRGSISRKRLTHCHNVLERLVDVGMALRMGHHQCMGRCAIAIFDAVDLDARRTAAQQPEVAEHVAFDTIEHERDPRTPGLFGTPIVRRAIEALGDKADAAQHLRRPTEIPPKAAMLARKAVKILAETGVPAWRVDLGAAQLDAARLVISERNPPIETVSAKVDQPPPTSGEMGERVEHAEGGILGMCSGHD